MTKAICLLLLPFGAVASASDWPQFRGPGGSAVSDEKNLPVKWGPKEGIRWQADLPGRGLSGVVVARGRAYVTACSGYRERRLHVLCFDAASGKKLWERQLAATGSTQCHSKTCMAAPTPASDGDAVYALFATGDLAALDRDGNLLWYRSLVGDYPDVTNQVGLAASPVLAGQTLLVPMENAGDSFAAGLDKRTGKNLWKVKRPRDINWTTPLVVGSASKQAAVFHTAKEATAYAVTTGKVLWSHAGEGLSSIKSPATGAGLVFVPGGELVALRPGPAGSTPEVAWKTSKLTDGYASPVYHDGRLYGLNPAAVVCLKADTGDELWKQRLPGPFAASPVIGDGKLYQVNERGVTTVLETGDRATVLATNRLYEGDKVDDRDLILCTPALAEGALWVRSDRRLFCIGAPKGAAEKD